MLAYQDLVMLYQVLVLVTQLLQQIFVDILSSCLKEHLVVRFHILLAGLKRCEGLITVSSALLSNGYR